MITPPETLYLWDTNAATRFLSGRDRRLVDLAHKHRKQIRLSPVVWFELRYGVEKRPELEHLGARLNGLREHIVEVEPFDERAAWWAARVRAYLGRLKPNAQPIGPYDMLLAGHALALDAVVVTHNVREFSRVPGLQIEDWQGC